VKKLLLLLAVILWANTFAHAQVVRQLNSTPDDAEIRALVDKYIESINNADSILGYSLFAHVGRVSFIHGGGEEQSWEEICKNVYKLLGERYSMRKLNVDYEDVWLLECAAMVEIHYTLEVTVKKDDSSVIFRIWETQMWRKMNNEWRLAVVHNSHNQNE
jgi:hypothetical protein